MRYQHVELRGHAHGYVLVSGEIEAQDAVVRSFRRRSMTPARTHTHPARRPLHLTCSISADGHIGSANNMMAVVLGYSREELESAPVGALLRPGENVHEQEAAIFEQFEAVRSGSSASEHFTSWMRAKSGTRVEVAATVTWSAHFNRWDIVAEVDANTSLPKQPQFPTPLDRIPMLEWMVARQQQRLRELAEQQLADKHATLEQLQKVAQEIIKQLLIEFQRSQGQVVPLKNNNNDQRHGGAHRRYADPEDVVRQASSIMAAEPDFYGITVQDVCTALRPKLSRNQLKTYFIRAGRMKEGDSLKGVLRQLGRDALDHLPALALAAVTVGVNLTN